jgi:hypothetical protein
VDFAARPIGDCTEMRSSCYIPTSVLLLSAFATTASAQKLDVKIVDRQDSEKTYTYFVPSNFSSQSNSSMNCYGETTCNQTTTSSGRLPRHKEFRTNFGNNVYVAIAGWQGRCSQLREQNRR